MSNFIDSLQLSGTNYSLKDPNATNVTSVTQAEYDALVTGGTLDPTVMYIISDAQPVDISQYWTSAQTNSAINEATSGKLDTSVFQTYSGSVESALSGKADTATTYTKTEVDNAITAGTSTKQDILSAGTGIDITNNVISVTGGGGGSSYTAGTNISISNDTINCTLPISARTTSLIYGGGTNTITVNSAVPLNYNNIFGTGNTLSATTNVNTRENSCNFIYGLDNSLKAGGMKLNHKFNLLFGSGNTIECSNAYGGDTVFGNVLIGFYNQITAQTQYSFVQGSNNVSSSNHQFIGGRYLVAKNSNEATFGTFNVSNTGSTDADKTIFSIGNGTANDARHNAFEIRKNGDIYISSGGTDIKLQDNLGGGGGGGSSYTAGTGIDITNDVISVTGMVATSAVTSAVTSGSTDVVTSGGVYDQLGGMKILHLTQAQYDQLQNKDNMTLYVITNS